MGLISNREIKIPEVEGKTIRSMRLIVTDSTRETEIFLEFTDGTGFSGVVCPQIDIQGEFYVGGVGAPQIIKRYGN